MVRHRGFEPPNHSLDITVYRAFEDYRLPIRLPIFRYFQIYHLYKQNPQTKKKQTKFAPNYRAEMTGGNTVPTTGCQTRPVI